MARNKNINLKHDLIIRTIIFIFFVLIFCSMFLFKNKIENFVNFALNKDAPSTIIDENGLVFHFLDVNQGDATIIEFPTGEIMLVDCGDNEKNSSEKFKKYLNSLDFVYENGEKVINYLILTHPDSDHIGNATYVFENFLIKNCYLPLIYYSEDETSPVPGGVISNSQVYKEVLNSLEIEKSVFDCNVIYSNEGLKISSNNYSEDNASTSNEMWLVEFFAPITGKVYRKSSTSNLAETNSYSPIIIINYMGKKIMITGDAGKEVEKDFIENVTDINYDYPLTYFDIDVLKVGHHGSKYSTTEDFLNIVSPEIAIISVGENHHGHPNEETLTRLNEIGINNNNIYRTDRNGNILIGISNDGELSLHSDYVQYITYEFKLWQIIIIGITFCGIIIYSPYLIKVVKIYKKTKKQNK